MSDFEERLERACADGKVSLGDADEIRNFASFLEACGGTVGPDSSPEERRRFREAYRTHYPEDYERAVAEQARREAGN